ncbi:MAG TPA: uridine diphosphate-N-acetylglucosamine-binding protein YvcK, partial [Acidimicrobiales bacterium]|nr:uridine diphosphate-N-acetylglucosamine-binding protein YvcK [Acidimicrobiales bacterium]
MTPGAEAERGPRVVALGGGHGLAATLRAVRRYAGSVTAVVSVADDGGSSGRLRQAFAIPAPGDLRRCLVALGDPDSAWAGYFEHRFDAGELEGHPLGNLVIAGLTGALGGDFIAAVEEAGRLVGCTSQVLPATTTPVVLKGAVGDGEIEGQVNVSSASRVSTVSLVPPDAPAPAAALEAIAAADQVVLGPGSLFTSVLAAAIVPGIRQALATTTARKVYVCNLRPQLPETDGFDVAAHVDALAAHGVHPDTVLCHRGGLRLGDCRIPVVEAEMATSEATSHDPVRL